MDFVWTAHVHYIESNADSVTHNLVIQDSHLFTVNTILFWTGSHKTDITVLLLLSNSFKYEANYSIVNTDENDADLQVRGIVILHLGLLRSSPPPFLYDGAVFLSLVFHLPWATWNTH